MSTIVKTGNRGSRGVFAALAVIYIILMSGLLAAAVWWQFSFGLAG